MKILFLDDDQNRTSEFKERMGSHDVTYAETPEEATVSISAPDQSVQDASGEPASNVTENKSALPLEEVKAEIPEEK